MATQTQLFWAAHRRVSDENEQFLNLVENGLTRADLEANIKRRPSLWARFSNWLDKLP